MNSQINNIALIDNRQLAFADHGPRDGPAVLFFHGSGSTADGLELDRRAIHHNIRIVSPARPGIGASSPSPGRSMSDWAHDVAQLADQLELQEFGLLGISGGGPYALAVAVGLPTRVNRVAVLSCGGPFEIAGAFDGMARPSRMMWSAIERRPRLARFMLGQQAKLVNTNPTKAVDRMIKSLAGADKHSIARLSPDQQRRFFAEPMAEALADGPGAMFDDMAILRRAWDFDVADVIQRVDLWHGAADTSAPLAMADHLAGHLPACELHVGAEAGHLSTILDEVDFALSLLHRSDR